MIILIIIMCCTLFCLMKILCRICNDDEINEIIGFIYFGMGIIFVLLSITAINYIVFKIIGEI